ncbi:MAG: mobilization protein [Sulfitobacter sp.]
MAETELERAEKRFAQAKARLQGIRNREATKQRKMDTRRKVILGGALLDLAERDTGAAAMLDRLIRNLAREQDRKAFADWEGPSIAADAPSGSPSPAPDADGTS